MYWDKYEIGDKVMILEGTRFYGSGGENPADVVGEVTAVNYPAINSGEDLHISVKWSDTMDNCYHDDDLILVSPLRANFGRLNNFKFR